MDLEGVYGIATGGIGDNFPYTEITALLVPVEDPSGVLFHILLEKDSRDGLATYLLYSQFTSMKGPVSRNNIGTYLIDGITKAERKLYELPIPEHYTHQGISSLLSWLMYEVRHTFNEDVR